MLRRVSLVVVVAAALALVASGCGGSGSSRGAGGGSTSSSNASVLVGAGSSLVYPLMSQWIGDYSKKEGVTVTYGPIGSGGGIAQITARTVDFGATDAPLTPDQAKAAKGVVQIPWALAATLVAYNVGGAPSKLKLTGPVVAQMFLGKIKTWNDPAIAKLNPGVTLPATKITPIYRSDGSGDTYAFTDYLTKVSPEWRSTVGEASTEVRFPAGLGGKGNSGVGGTLSRTDGGVAYVAISYVFQNKFAYALLRNRAGNYPEPRTGSIAASAASVSELGPDNATSLVDPPASAAGAYPLSTFTYVLIPKDSPKLAALKKFVAYGIGEGQDAAAKLQFAPLPGKVVAADRRALAALGRG